MLMDICYYELALRLLRHPWKEFSLCRLLSVGRQLKLNHIRINVPEHQEVSCLLQTRKLFLLRHEIVLG